MASSTKKGLENIYSIITAVIHSFFLRILSFAKTAIIHKVNTHTSGLIKKASILEKIKNTGKNSEIDEL